ncbi:jg16545 [Pararge aegeria aegeria]|uniref:Jg16545 protein n=1 Tax=Pararge aegeria aegeria TaxID=348720 RepID=A0A8S4SM16_9NEOP|nr:jg16545 [Pararge aegeria aegeria]
MDKLKKIIIKIRANVRKVALSNMTQRALLPVGTSLKKFGVSVQKRALHGGRYYKAEDDITVPQRGHHNDTYCRSSNHRTHPSRLNIRHVSNVNNGETIGEVRRQTTSYVTAARTTTARDGITDSPLCRACMEADEDRPEPSVPSPEEEEEEVHEIKHLHYDINKTIIHKELQQRIRKNKTTFSNGMAEIGDPHTLIYSTVSQLYKNYQRTIFLDFF